MLRLRAWVCDFGIFRALVWSVCVISTLLKFLIPSQLFLQLLIFMHLSIYSHHEVKTLKFGKIYNYMCFRIRTDSMWMTDWTSGSSWAVISPRDIQQLHSNLPLALAWHCHVLSRCVRKQSLVLSCFIPSPPVCVVVLPTESELWPEYPLIKLWNLHSSEMAAWLLLWLTCMYMLSC